MPQDLAGIETLSLWAYLLVFAGGVATSIGPCNVAMIPLVVAFVGGRRDLGRGRSFVLSAAFAFGLALTLALLGVIASLAGGLIGGTSRIWYYAVAAVCIVMGLHTARIVSLPIPEIGAAQRERIARRGVFGALLFGLASGLVASGCATPALAAILTYAMARQTLLYGASLLLVYGLGRGVPIVLVGSFAGLVKLLPRLAPWTARLEVGSGALMIGVGLYFLWIA